MSRHKVFGLFVAGLCFVLAGCGKTRAVPIVGGDEETEDPAISGEKEHDSQEVDQVGDEEPSRFLIPYALAAHRLAEFEERTISVKVLDKAGAPEHAGVTVRFALEGTGRGAVLSELEAAPDEHGVAQTQVTAQFTADFNVAVRVAGADKLLIPVNVSAAEGALQLTLFTRFESSVSDATVTLFDGIDCATLAGLETIPNGEATENVAVTPSGVAVQVPGLKLHRSYTVWVSGEIAGHTFFRGCLDGVTLNQDQVDRREPVSKTLFLEDPAPWLNPVAWLVETRPAAPMSLGETAALLGRLGHLSDDPLGRVKPVIYVLDELIFRSNLASTYTDLLDLAKGAIVNALGVHVNVSVVASKFGQLASALLGLSDLRLYSRMHLEPGASENELNMLHSLAYATVVDETLRVIQFVPRPAADGNSDPGGQVGLGFVRNLQNLGGQVGLGFMRNLRIRGELDGTELKIHRHPVDMDLSALMLDHLQWEILGELDPGWTLALAVPCDALARTAWHVILGGEFRPSLDKGLMFSFIARVEDACRTVQTNLEPALRRAMEIDLRAMGLPPRIELEGTAQVELLDGKLHRAIGDWDAEFGQFSAEAL